MTTEDEAIKRGRKWVEELGLLPPNKLTPKAFADQARTMARKRKIKISVLSEREMKKMGMGGVVAVSQGSSEQAQGIILDYNPRGAKTSIGLAGKTVTFDSGGLSLKSPRGLHEMKYDMIGGATVLAIMDIASQLKVPHRIIAVLIAAENLPSGNAMRPGDVITMYNGTTVEIINTDAEGRLLLADSLSYLQDTFHPSLIIDIATLTHGIAATLGNKITGAFGTNDKFNQKLLVAADASEEPIHFLPLFDEYLDEIKSRVADLSNVSPKSKFDTVIAALFLKQFVHKTSWIHLDIGATSYDSTGPTGVMVKTLTEFLKTF